MYTSFAIEFIYCESTTSKRIKTKSTELGRRVQRKKNYRKKNRGEFREEILIGSASTAESRSSRRLSTEVYLTRIQTRKGPPPFSLFLFSLVLLVSIPFHLPPSYKSEESQEQIDKERGSPESFTPGSQPPSSRFLLDATPDITLSRASCVCPRSRKLRQSRYQGQGKKRPLP